MAGVKTQTVKDVVGQWPHFPSPAQKVTVHYMFDLQTSQKQASVETLSTNKQKKGNFQYAKKAI